MATPSKPLSSDNYFSTTGGFMWHRAINAILERWDETNKILRQLADFEAYKSYEDGLEEGRKENGRLGQP